MPSNNFKRATTPPPNVNDLEPIDLQRIPQPLPPVTTPTEPFRFSSLQIAPAPPVLSTQPDQLKNWTRPLVSQQRVFSPAPQQSVAVGAGSASQTKAQIAPTEKIATSAAATANVASSNATNAVMTANTAVTGVTTINAQTAVAVVGGVLQQVPISTLDLISLTPTLDALNDGST